MSYSTPNAVLNGILTGEITKVVIKDSDGITTKFSDFVAKNDYSTTPHTTVIMLKTSFITAHLDFGKPEKFVFKNRNKFIYTVNEESVFTVTVS